MHTFLFWFLRADKFDIRDLISFYKNLRMMVLNLKPTPFYEILNLFD